MNSKAITCAIAALSMGLSGFAVAQQDKDIRADRAARQYERPEANRDHDRPAPHHMGRGAGPDHNFYRGDRLPPQYHERQYVVSDWRGHHLRQPPRGYHWVQSGNDFLLVAITTGVIAKPERVTKSSRRPITAP